jgi:FkbM family methyltransferase
VAESPQAASPAVASLLEMFPDDFEIVVLDVGAALSERPPYQSLVEAGYARVIGFEPDVAACEKLNRSHGAPHRFFPMFVGAGGPAVFHETSWSLTGSLYPPNTPVLERFQNLAEAVRPIAEHAVSTARLDDIDEIDDVDFFKIDAQGAALVILENGQRVLRSAVVVQVEVEFVELYRGQPLFADVDSFLRRQGFQFHSFLGFGGRAFKPIVRGKDANQPYRQMLWSDAVYVRDWMRLDDLSTAKLRSYAIIVNDLFQSLDLAHLVLTALDGKQGSALARTYLRRLGDHYERRRLP